MTASDVLRALRDLGQVDREAHHSIHDIWWPLRDLGSTGDVERLLWDLWEVEDVENPADGRWRLARPRAGVQGSLLADDVPAVWGDA